MIGASQEAIIIHDGRTILECSDAFCDLFRCDCLAVVDMRMEQLISGDDFKALAIWRGKHIMAHQDDKEFRQHYAFLRCDGSTFWGEAISRRVAPDRFETKIKWKYDDPVRPK